MLGCGSYVHIYLQLTAGFCKQGILAGDGSCVVYINTVDWVIFASKNICLLIFRVVVFLSL
jgi:hypothetical protein